MRFRLLKLALSLLVALTFGCQPLAGEPPSVGPSGATPLEEIALNQKSSLRDTVTVLADKIGERNLLHYEKLEQARSYITRRLERAGYQVELQQYEVGRPVTNIIASKPGNEEVVVVGAHYDSMSGTPGANDNGSGVAVLLQLAERFAEASPKRTLRFVFFVNEEPPYFHTDNMGSERYAKLCKDRGDKIVGMLSLETVGYYSDEPGSQKFPPGITGYPDRGNFVAFVAEPNSQEFLDSCLSYFHEFAVESLVAPASVEGVAWSDHASFWKYGFPGVMVTDTAPFRYPHYHRATDTADKIDYGKLESLSVSLENMIAKLTEVRRD